MRAEDGTTALLYTVGPARSTSTPPAIADHKVSGPGGSRPWLAEAPTCQHSAAHGGVRAVPGLGWPPRPPGPLAPP